MNKKLRKMMTKPHLFLADAAKNKLRKIRPAVKVGATAPARPKDAGVRYSVISAVYGVEQYLEEYFSSMVKQTLNFQKNVELIMVDDGSLDRSAEIIKAWQAKYPKNIRYIKQENGGQAAARNTGIPYARGEWVTFVDPDDFVDKGYFAEIENFLAAPGADKLGMVSCNFIFYIENNKKFVDSHPLKYRFAKGNVMLPPGDLAKHMQLSVNSAFFKRTVLESKAIRFNPAIRPCFEDAHFVGQYLLQTKELRTGFCAKSKYYYRKREDGTSTLDGSWAKPAYFTDVLRLGCADLAEMAAANGGVAPVWLQRTILYHLFWSITRIVGSPMALAHLSAEDRAEFERLTYHLFSFISAKTVMEFELAGCWFFHKVGLLGMFYDQAPGTQIAYIENYDPAKKMVLVRYFIHDALPMESVMIDGRDVAPAHAKSREHVLFNRKFATERLIWVRTPNAHGRLTLALNGTPVRLTFKGKQHPLGLPVQDIISHLVAPKVVDANLPLHVRLVRYTARQASVRQRFKNAWIFMDRDTVADDNGEHLYRFVRRSHPEINAYFVLRDTSPDWSRLKGEGFRMLAFGSLAHKQCLLNADHVVSSHADGYVTNYLQPKWYRDMLHFKYSFLQHGVTKDDISTWLNSKDIGVFVTSTADEHESIAGENNRYKFTRKDVIMSGMPRHDALLKSPVPTEKMILIMPTWRLSLVGKIVGKGNERTVNPDFHLSSFAQHWKEALHSPRLKALAEEHGYKLAFFPHTNLLPYLDWFEVPDHVELMKQGPAGSMQVVFRKAAMMVTDYSSVAFELAFLDKPTVYFQFDRETHFAGAHTTEKGYYDYDLQGFGPCVFTTDTLMDAIESTVTAGGMVPEYLDRVNKTFLLRDGQNCRRTFEAIAALDVPDADAASGSRLAVVGARAALAAENWPLVQARWAALPAAGMDMADLERSLALAAAQMRLGVAGEAHAILEDMDHASLLALAAGQPLEVLLSLARAYRAVGFTRYAKRILRLVGSAKGHGEVIAEHAAIAGKLGKHHRAARAWGNAIATRQVPVQAHMHLAESLLSIGQFGEAQVQLRAFERRTARTPASLLGYVEVANHQRKLPAAKTLLTQLAKDAQKLPTVEHRRRTAKVLRDAGMRKEALAVYPAPKRALCGKELFDYSGLLFANGYWQTLLNVDISEADTLDQAQHDELQYQRAFACFKKSAFENAWDMVKPLYEANPENVLYLRLYADASQSMEDWQMASQLWPRYLALSPGENNKKIVANSVIALDKAGRTPEAAQLLFHSTKSTLFAQLMKDPNSMAASMQLLQLLSMPVSGVSATAAPEVPRLAIIKNL